MSNLEIYVLIGYYKPPCTTPERMPLRSNYEATMVTGAGLSVVVTVTVTVTVA